MKPSWHLYRVSPDGTHHISQEEGAYSARFKRVLPYHPPGIAPVVDASGAYHIDPVGKAIYSKRYSRTFGYYCGRAAVTDKEGSFHILADGTPLYEARYAWCGNFQHDICTVKDSAGNFFHIDAEGARLYPENYSYAGDFREGAAVVQRSDGLHFHIDRAGSLIYSHSFLDLDVFHKGFARARDRGGWFHIDRSGHPLYRERYASIEPFYNGIARVATERGDLLLIDETGSVVHTLREGEGDPFHDVSRRLVSYWELFTLKAAHDLSLFDALPDTLPHLSQRVGLTESMAERLLLGLQEMEYVTKCNGVWSATPTGAFLTSSHTASLRDAHELWLGEHLASWKELTPSLQRHESAFERLYKSSWFDFLESHPEKRRLYHNALSTYAARDYRELGKKIDFSACRSIADIGGSQGATLDLLMQEYPHLRGHLLDLPSVLTHIPPTSPLRKRVELHPLNFFDTWPKLEVEAAILSRVIHDWPDREAIHILRKSRSLLKHNRGRLYVIENILDKESGSGALLDLNMLVMTGGKERTSTEFAVLFQEAGYRLESTTPLNAVSSIFVLNPL